MIRIEDLRKSFGGREAPSVIDLTLDIPTGETCVLIGPSGCGKTTTLRMINRLIEPSAGRILVDGEDVSSVDPVLLRRRIGYVIQGVGLFPHLSVADNVSTVPRLLGWASGRISARVDEMLALVGLAPEEFAHRRPATLSGGQRQRVGVARALAADPPVMLMDEPFGAVDPVVRARLQREFGALLRRLGKTVVLVTHDMDEAIRMGDRIAIMREGRLVQYDRPERLLARPADAFVAEFVGGDGPMKRLSLLLVDDAISPEILHGIGTTENVPAVVAGSSLAAALAAMLAGGADRASVVGPAAAETVGIVTLQRIREMAATRRGEAPPA